MRILTSGLVLGLVVSLPLHAAPIDGVAVDRAGNDLSLGNVVDYFIPLSRARSGYFGEGAGQTADTCSTSTSSSRPRCGGGWLEMLFAFDPEESGEHQLDLWFEDCLTSAPMGQI
jgi:hypothetical protein